MHILDRPVWTSLTSVHEHLSTGTTLARKFQSGISPFAATKDESDQALLNLAELMPIDGHIIVAQADPIVCPPGSCAITRHTAVQMLFDDFKTQPEPRHTIKRLSQDDAPAMVALADLTKPGPFLDRTHILGDFWGVKQDGHLIAMAGERFKQPGFTEVSGVCTHPDHQGRGLARELIAIVLARIVGRGEKPYLHAYTDNIYAIKLYEKLGFCERKIMHTALIERI